MRCPIRVKRDEMNTSLYQVVNLKLQIYSGGSKKEISYNGFFFLLQFFKVPSYRTQLICCCKEGRNLKLHTKFVVFLE